MCYLVLLLLSVFVLLTGSFKWLPHRPHLFKYHQLHGSTHDESSHLFNVASSLAVPGNTKDTLINLINYGDNWSKKYNNIESNWTYSNWEKVIGCMADVRVDTTINSVLSNDILTYKFQASADSRVARGMIGLLCDGLYNQTTETILNLSSDDVILKCGLTNLLPPGRLNGFANMIDLIKLQVNRLHQLHLTATSPISATSPGSVVIPDWMANANNEIAVLLSGGVDSSVALKLLQLQGHKLRAFYLKIWLEDEIAHLNQCPWEEDLEYAQKVCDKLEIPLETISLQREYWNEVVQYTLAEARRGRTPNPDIMCNSRIKFGMFYRYVGQYFHKVATGHYAQAVTVGDVTSLVMSPDSVKDQTYFLANLNQNQLNKAIFPIGHLLKHQVRELAAEYSLPTMSRKDSQGICFLGKLKFEEFIGHYLGESKGEMYDYETNEVIGEHKGLWFHTIGQRKGIGLLLHPGYVHNGPWMVVSKDTVLNRLYITNKPHLLAENQYNHEFKVENINWISGEEPVGIDNGIQVEVKLRHGPTILPCIVTQLPHKEGVNVKLLKQDKGVAPGQFAVFYEKNKCLGTGSIADEALGYVAREEAGDIDVYSDDNDT